MDTVLFVGQVVLCMIGGAVVALHGIAPLTKNKKDDLALSWLVKVEGWLRVVLPSTPQPKVETPWLAKTKLSQHQPPK